MKNKTDKPEAVKDLCRKLKIQLDELSVTIDDPLPREEKARRSKLMEQLKEQLEALS